MGALLVVSMSEPQTGSIGNGVDAENVKRTVTLTENAMNVESQLSQQRPVKFDVAQRINPVVSSHLGGIYAPAPAAGYNDDLISIMARQNEITAMLVHQQNLSSLPNREIQVFDGDPLLYHAFMRAFERNIEEKTGDARDCLHFLEQYTRGQPRELVRSCQQMAADRGYHKAKALLEQHFGNEQRIASAYLDKALLWPIIKAEDVKALQAYVIIEPPFLTSWALLSAM